MKNYTRWIILILLFFVAGDNSVYSSADPVAVDYFTITAASPSCMVFSGKPEIKICEDGFFVNGEKVTRDKTMYYKMKDLLNGKCNCED